jgi:hypothetical protein
MYMKWNNWLFTIYIRHIESHEHTNFCWAELVCEATAERFGTANLSRLVSSPNVKSFSEKCILQTYCLDSFLSSCALQAMPNVFAHSWAQCKNGTRKYKSETVMPTIIVLCYSFTLGWMIFANYFFDLCNKMNTRIWIKRLSPHVINY